MSAEIRVEAATSEDVPLLLELIRALADYERMSADVVATEARLRDTLFGSTPGAEAVIARVANEAVGFALWFHNYSTFLGQPGLYLEDLFVLPEWRGRGVGSVLLRYLAGVAVERGCGRMEWSVLNWNEPAIGFYKKLGAQPMDEWTVYRLTGSELARLASGE
ncbi:MAG: GNAT family N-acetyltransferase [Acidobacteria bacterium]|nr:GNAT family N-acetyltransferase [Acidobacteriota bacterium]